jgi:hypothetical protein
MGKIRDRRCVVAVALAAAASLAVVAALVKADAPEPVRPEYVPLGEPLGRIAQNVSLREDLVPRATYGREFAQVGGRIPGSDTDSMSIDVERITPRGGRPTTIVTLGVSRRTGSDMVLVPWTVSRAIPNEEFVLSGDFSDVQLHTRICDDRTGATKPLVVEWTMKGFFSTRPPYGMLASHGGSAEFTARYGDEQIVMADPGAVNVQIWSHPVDRRDPHLQVDGKRRKPVKCPR